MDNVLQNQELRLSAFGEFLLKQRLVKEEHARYHVLWVRKFLAQRITTPVSSMTDRVALFVESLQASGNYQDWQLAQAERALRLYFVNFSKDTSPTPAPSTSIQAGSDGSFLKAAVFDAMRTIIRVKHYSYSTERTYLDWVRRLFDYLGETGHSPSPETVRINEDRIKDFIAYLATRKNVAASTQNQAFGALLFLCREVLRLELGSLEQGVRAKRGSKLPVVLTPQEVVELLGGMQGVARLMAELIYGGGLRVMECCRLRVKDLDFDNNLVFVREAIRQIQEYLGHVHVETTMIYTHVVKDMRNPAKSPLDVLRSIKMA